MNLNYMFKNPEWMISALCAASGDPEAFYPPKGGAGTRNAKAVCNQCEVRLQCLEYALDRGETLGVWGGKSERERAALRTQRRRAAEAAA